jgi:hypothetical protein
MKGIVVFLAAVLFAASAAPVLAHHAFGAEFDREKPLTLTGSVTKVQWSNPHIWIFIDVKGPDGTVTNWGFQGGPPAYLARVGWSKMDLKVGEMVTISGSRAKDGSPLASGAKVTFADGRTVFAGTADQVGEVK